MSSAFFQGVYWGLVVVASGVRVVYTARYGKTAHAKGLSTGVDALLTALPRLWQRCYSSRLRKDGIAGAAGPETSRVSLILPQGP